MTQPDPTQQQTGQQQQAVRPWWHGALAVAGAVLGGAALTISGVKSELADHQRQIGRIEAEVHQHERALDRVERKLDRVLSNQDHDHGGKR